MLKRINHRLPQEKMILVAEAIFCSSIRYGIPVFYKPRLTDTDEFCTIQEKLQVCQNDMIRLLFGHKRSDRINMQKLREKMGILSVNQLACYHILLETFNILNKNSSPQIEDKIKPKGKSHYHTRSSERKDLNVMNKPKKNCIGFTYISAKLWNMLPVQIRDQKSPEPFKAAIKSWIPSNIPD